MALELMSETEKSTSASEKMEKGLESELFLLMV